jgi:hypothetical protein
VVQTKKMKLKIQMVNILIPSISISLISAFSEKATNQPVT